MTSCTLPGAPSLLGAVYAAGTLDEVMVSAWEELSAHRSVACPVCQGEMRPQYGVHARAIGGRCSACGSIMR